MRNTHHGGMAGAWETEEAGSQSVGGRPGMRVGAGGRVAWQAVSLPWGTADPAWSDGREPLSPGLASSILNCTFLIVGPELLCWGLCGEAPCSAR